MGNFENFKHTELTSKIINAAYYVYNYFGYGHLESVYEKSLAIKLRKEGFFVKTQSPIRVYFEGELVGKFKADLVVNDTVIIELKANHELHQKNEVQLVNYLKSSEIEVGLLFNFGEKIDIKRRVFSNHKKRKLKRIP